MIFCQLSLRQHPAFSFVDFLESVWPFLDTWWEDISTDSPVPRMAPALDPSVAGGLVTYRPRNYQLEMLGASMKENIIIAVSE